MNSVLSLALLSLAVLCGLAAAGLPGRDGYRQHPGQPGYPGEPGYPGHPCQGPECPGYNPCFGNRDCDGCPPSGCQPVTQPPTPPPAYAPTCRAGYTHRSHNRIGMCSPNTGFCCKD